MAEQLVIIGGGGCAREVLDVIDALDVRVRPLVVGILDDGVPDASLLAPYGVRRIGSTSDRSSLPGDVSHVLGIGSPSVRAALAVQVVGRVSAPLVHPTAAIGRRNVRIGDGVVVCSHVSVQSHVAVGRHVHINQNCTVGHDVWIGDFSVISPLVAISGNVRLGRAVLVGAGASILPGVTIGDGATIGAGAAVIGDVAAGSTVVGVPARPVRGRPRSEAESPVG